MEDRSAYCFHSSKPFLANGGLKGREHVHKIDVAVIVGE